MPKNIDRLQRRNNIPFMGNVYVERERGIYIDEFIKSAQMFALHLVSSKTLRSPDMMMCLVVSLE